MIQIEEYTRMQMIEKIMFLVGRRLKRAKQYRQDLYDMTLPEVRREQELIARDLKYES